MCHRFLHCRPFICHATDLGRAVFPNLRRWSEDLHGCRWIRFLGSALAWPLTIILLQLLYRWFHHSVCTRSTVSRSANLSLISHNDLVVRSFIWLSYLCNFIWINLDMCSTSRGILMHMRPVQPYMAPNFSVYVCVCVCYFSWYFPNTRWRCPDPACELRDGF
jgi:hypothetical protein